MERQEVVIGRILGPKGIRGEVKVLPLTFSIKRFEQVRRVYTELKGQRASLPIEYVKPYREMVLLKFSGIDDRTTAESLRGKDLKIPIEESPPPPEGSYYHYQIIGLRVYTVEGRYIGRVEEIIETGANDVLVVRNEIEYLVPAVDKFIKEIDLDSGRLIVDPVEGLLEVYERR